MPTLRIRIHHLAVLLGGIVLASPLLASSDASNTPPPGLRAAFDAAQRGQLDLAGAARFQDHPLGGWLQALVLERRVASMPRRELDAALSRLGNQPAADRLREAWLRAAASRGQWADVLALSRPSTDPALACLRLSAQQAETGIDARWQQEAKTLYRHGDSRPVECNPVFAALDGMGGLDDALRIERVMLAAEAGNTGLMRAVAGGLPAAERQRVEQHARYLERPDASAAAWTPGQRQQRIATLALVKLARRDAGAAESLLGRLSRLLPAESAGHGEVRASIALWTAANYAPDAMRRLAAVPAGAFDDALHGWAVRTALANGDEAAALRAISVMPDTLRQQSQWRLLEGLLRERAGEAATARTLFASAAREPNFHGFLAADRVGSDYALCPLEPPSSRAARDAVAALPGLQRALALYHLDQAALAAREWSALVASITPEQRRLAVQQALDAHWYDRAVFGLDGSDPDTLRHYSLRFPLHHDATLRRQARRNGLDPAFVAGLTRAESIFNPLARSPANARGLMQLLPATAQGVAQRLNQPWSGAESLYQPQVNITLGTAYLRERLAINNGMAFRAVAAYNAGQGAVARWVAQRPQLIPEFWIETIPYRETRDYVPRVLAFSVIYDWRLHGDARPLTDRLLGRDSGERKRFACPNNPTLAEVAR